MVVDYAKSKSNRDAARKYAIDEKRVREWRANADKLKQGAKKMRIEGGGCKIKNADLEEDLLDWIHERRANSLRVSRKLTMRKAKYMHDETAGDDPVAKNRFHARRGWLEKFMKRNCLSLRRRTTTIQKDPAHIVDRLVQYVLHVRRMSRKYKLNPNSILAMNETAVWADMTAPTTVERCGEREVILKSTSHEKVRISVCLTAKADGTKLKPFIVFGGAKRECKELNTEFRNKCVIVSSKNAWMNEEVTLHFVETILGTFSFNRRLLAWDSFECHMMDSVKRELLKGKIENVIIPGGCTKYIQAPDVSWNKPLKSRIIDVYNEWLTDGVQQFTKGGNQKPPLRRKMVEWVLKHGMD